jgi:hypothetical protein
MARTYLFWISLVFLTALAAFTLACGGSSSTPPPTACTGTFNVVGDWEGSLVTTGGTDDVLGVINSSGQAVVFDDLADIAVLPAISGACSFSGALAAYASVESGAEGSATGTAQGNVTSDSAINGSESINGSNGTFTLQSYSPITAVTAVSGLTVGAVEGQTVDDLNLTLSGTSSSISFTGNDGDDCAFNGTFTEETTTNVYDVTFDVSGGTCNASNLTGVGFEATSDLLGLYNGENPPQGTYLYAIVTSSSAPFVLEVPPVLERAAFASHHRISGPGMSGPAFHGALGFRKHSSR